MSETYYRPNSDPLHTEEAKRLADRMLLLVKQDPDFEKQMIADGDSVAHFSNPEVCEVYIHYFPNPRTSYYLGELVLHDDSFANESPVVIFNIENKNKGLNHSSIGPVPETFVAPDGALYGTINEFYFNGVGQSYRDERLEMDLSAEIVERSPQPDAPKLDTQPQEKDLLERINSLDPSDFEMIGYYLDQIDQGVLVRTN